ncbi:serine hydrolase domain-containing protein [Sandarakinorhabdus limnophila]|jgi:CubicO group peptidase (beta-lactamase class C family)|uniref:serine hydrolase domain-containing protein n=1 Tax=Sandarakinorhabdus limnophila TaxID=210512 RepID=UPI0031378455
MIPLIAMIAAFYGPEPAGRVAETADMANFAGIVLLSEGGKVTLEKGFGTKVPQRMVRARTPSDFLPGDSWRWASVTKQITATIAMQDVAAGRLDLNAPITRYLPAFKGPTGKRITVGMLLGHTSGLPDSNAGDGGAFRPGARVLPDAVCAGAVRDQPGKSFNYDNCDYIIAGRVLEVVNRKPYAQLLTERITKPLGMTSVRIAGPHVAGLGEAPVNLAAYGAAGAITGTIRDLWRFDQALINGKLLPATDRAKMWEGRPQYGYAALGQWAYDVKLRGCDASQRIIERRGAIGGVQVRNYILPERNIVLIAMTNRDKTDFGELWQSAGLGYELLSAAACKAVDA